MRYRYRVHAHDGGDLEVVEHPAPNLEPGDVILLSDNREGLVTVRVEVTKGPFAALLEVALSGDRAGI